MHPRLLILVAALHAHAVVAFTYRELTSRTLREATSFGDSSVDFPSGEQPRCYRCLVLQATTGGDGKGDGGKKPYRFGDITKSLIGGRVEKVTGKPYEFGGERTIYWRMHANPHNY